MDSRDEINKIFRLKEHNRSLELDFVVGYKINLGNKEQLECKLCSMLRGDYPKSFQWTGWHDGCICYRTNILLPDEIFREKRVISLKEAFLGVKIQEENYDDYYINDYPNNFKILGGFPENKILNDDDAKIAYERIKKLYADQPVKWDDNIIAKELEDKKDYDEAIVFYKKKLCSTESEATQFAIKRIIAIYGRQKRHKELKDVLELIISKYPYSYQSKLWKDKLYSLTEKYHLD